MSVKWDVSGESGKVPFLLSGCVFFCVVVSHESGFSQDCGGNVPLSLEQDTHILPALCLYLETQTGSGH